MSTMTRRTAVSKLRSGQSKKAGGTYHHHQCSDRSCRRTFRHSCQDPLEERESAKLLCYQCSGMAHGWPIIYRFLLPQACCADNSVLITDPDSVRVYKLAGLHPWYQCRVCFHAGGWPNPKAER